MVKDPTQNRPEALDPGRTTAGPKGLIEIEAPAREGESETSAPDAREGAPPSAGASIAAGQDEIETLRRERDGYHERLLRMAAEFDNFRKRVERERREQAEFAAGTVLAAVLPILDDLERALRAEAGPEVDGYRRGVDLIYRQLLDLLASRGVRPIEAAGARFDPRFHEAVLHVESPDHENGEVIEELRRGYVMGDRLLRPALVKVAKA